MTEQHFVWLVLAYADESDGAAVMSYALMDLRRVVSMTVASIPVTPAGSEADPTHRVIGTIDLGTGREGMLLTRGRRATEEAMTIIQAYADALPAPPGSDDTTDIARSTTERLFGP